MDPVWGIGCLGLNEFFGDEGGDGADVFFVELEDSGACWGGVKGGDGCAWAELEVAGAGAGDGATRGGGVEEVEGFAGGWGVGLDGDEGADLEAVLEAGVEGGAAGGEGLEADAGGLVFPDLVGGDACWLGGVLLGEAGDPEEGEEVAGVLEAGQDGGVEEVGDGGCFADAGEAREGAGLVSWHGRLSGGPSLRSGRSVRGSGVRRCRLARGGFSRR